MFFIAIVAAVVVIILIMILLLGNIKSRAPTQTTTLQFWGVFDDREVINAVLDKYKSVNRQIRIVYKQFSYDEYEQKLIDAFASGTGPDIWMMHNTWLPKHGDKIVALPQNLQGEDGEPLFTITDFQNQFVDVAVDDLTIDGRIAALPVYIDTLALYYNKDLFNSVGLTRAPETWEEFNDAVNRLTVVDNDGNIVRSGAAIGTARNVNRSTDILMLMMLQSGVQMTNSTNTTATFTSAVDREKVGELALQYYTDFANPLKRKVYTWNDGQNYSIDDFIEGDTAMMFNYSHHIATIRDKAARFNFGIASMPQIKDAPIKVNYANYWAPTVSKSSGNAIEAWKFVLFMSSAEGAAAYLDASGRPAARRDLIEQQKRKPDIGIFAEQSLSARSWYQVDNTDIEKIFADMIDDVNFGRRSVRDALENAERQVNVLMRRARN